MSNSPAHMPVHERPEWEVLQAHQREISNMHMRDLFANDPQRFENFSAKIPGLLLDYSKHRITDETMNALLALARACNIERQRDAMFSGNKINSSENRAVLHTALRRSADEKIILDGEDIMSFVYKTLFRMRDFSDAVRSGTWTGCTGRRIKTVINIGVGGSDLGPQMVCEALKPYAERMAESCGQTVDLAVRFVSNIDATMLHDTLQDCDPETTLFIVASKSFTTQETITNALGVKAWLLDTLSDETAIKRHFVALSANEEAAMQFGIPPENIFPMKDWVGGRYSLWGAIGLSICCAAGFDVFQDLLAGASAMDHHFQSTPLDKNIPVIMAILGIWNRNFQGYPAQAILPYAHHLQRFSTYIQQLDMESNGKGVTADGRPVSVASGPIIFGEVGTNAQHTFMQLLHQSPEVIPADFIMVAKPVPPYENQHKKLLANALAQSKSLMEGQENSEEPHRNFPGNRPSSCVVLDTLDAYHLGLLLALYEHKIFVQGVIWGINSFDQWGVELGKTNAKHIIDAFETHKKIDTLDSSTAGILRHLTQKFIKF
ncbi:MAG TPA: glucose-6-phosphate isomerase [Alphaproteobacteria bacterium]|nr:glucose-6-phosphate isomerase [Alphaproteobacteria bacterium]